MNISVTLIFESVIAYGIIYLFNISISNWLSLILGVVIYVLFYIILLIPFLNLYEKNLITEFLKKLKKKFAF